MSYHKYFQKKEQTPRSEWKSTRLYVKGADLPKQKLDYSKCSSCGGKGSKWVKKSSLSHRMTLVTCECQVNSEPV